MSDDDTQFIDQLNAKNQRLYDLLSPHLGPRPIGPPDDNVMTTLSAANDRIQELLSLIEELHDEYEEEITQQLENQRTRLSRKYRAVKLAALREKDKHMQSHIATITKHVTQLASKHKSDGIQKMKRRFAGSSVREVGDGNGSTKEEVPMEHLEQSNQLFDVHPPITKVLDESKQVVNDIEKDQIMESVAAVAAVAAAADNSAADNSDAKEKAMATTKAKAAANLAIHKAKSLSSQKMTAAVAGKKRRNKKKSK